MGIPLPIVAFFVLHWLSSVFFQTFFLHLTAEMEHICQRQLKQAARQRGCLALLFGWRQ